VLNSSKETSAVSDIVITGIGVASSAGDQTPAFFESIREGRSDLSPLPFPAESFQSRVCSRSSLEPSPMLPRFAQLGLHALGEALGDAGLQLPLEEPDGMALFNTVAIGGTAEVLDFVQDGTDDLRRHLRKATIALDPNLATSLYSNALGHTGEATTSTAGCTGFLQALGAAVEALRQGRCEIACCVASDAPLYAGSMSFYDRAGRLATNHPDQPGRVSRPFDSARSGFVMGEGAVALVLERSDTPRRARCKLGVPCSVTDGLGLAVRKDGSTVERAFRGALRAEGLSPEDIDLISAHASSSQLDLIESDGIRRVFGEDLDAQPPTYASKMLVGHTFSAAAGFQLLAAIWSIENQAVPPMPNLQERDPACHVNCLAESRATAVQSVLVDGISLGGTVTAMVVSAP